MTSQHTLIPDQQLRATLAEIRDYDHPNIDAAVAICWTNTDTLHEVEVFTHLILDGFIILYFDATMPYFGLTERSKRLLQEHQS